MAVAGRRPGAAVRGGEQVQAYTSLDDGPLRVGDRVRIKSQEAILATLDARGEVHGMPFMPEMLPLCGQSFTVTKRADKTCDMGQTGKLRRLTGTVHLDELRCDGSAHGGCDTACRFFWREEWVTREPVEDPDVVLDGSSSRPAEADGPGVDVDTLRRAATAGTDPATGEVRWSCQATRVHDASTPLSTIDVLQYYRDVASGNESLRRMLPRLAISLFNKFQDVSRRFLPRALRYRDGARYPFIAGSLTRTPSERQDLQPGDLVQIRSREEILATLDTNNRNRGMSFDVEMLKYCGRHARVQKRVERLIEESTGRMLDLRNECLILENVVCDGDFHRFCPRGMYPFWREIWVRRVEE